MVCPISGVCLYSSTPLETRTTLHADATPFLAPYPPRRVRRPVVLQLAEESYPLEELPAESWLSIAFRAFARLAAGRSVHDLLIIGSGNGLDALGAVEIFADLRSLSVTDLYPASLAATRANVLEHLVPGADIRLTFVAGDLLANVSPEARFSLVYENLPNIPAGADVELQRGINSGRFFEPTEMSVPEPFGRHLLALHYRLLRDVRPQVRDRGGVLTAIGGRVPDEVAFGLHRACGYVPELVAYDVKLQSESRLVVPGYSQVEERHSGVEFRFYAAEAVLLVTDAKRSGLEGQALADAVAPALLNLTLTAREAERRSQQGHPVAHSVLMIFGQLAASAAL